MTNYLVFVNTFGILPWLFKAGNSVDPLLNGETDKMDNGKRYAVVWQVPFKQLIYNYDWSASYQSLLLVDVNIEADPRVKHQAWEFWKHELCRCVQSLYGDKQKNKQEMMRAQFQDMSCILEKQYTHHHPLQLPSKSRGRLYRQLGWNELHYTQ